MGMKTRFVLGGKEELFKKKKKNKVTLPNILEKMERSFLPTYSTHFLTRGLSKKM